MKLTLIIDNADDGIAKAIQALTGVKVSEKPSEAEQALADKASRYAEELARATNEATHYKSMSGQDQDRIRQLESVLRATPARDVDGSISIEATLVWLKTMELERAHVAREMDQLLAKVASLEREFRKPRPAGDDTSLVSAVECAATGSVSVSWWLARVADGSAPQPAIRATRFTRWRTLDVVQFWADFAKKADPKAAERAMKNARKASAAAMAKRTAK